MTWIACSMCHGACGGSCMRKGWVTTTVAPRPVSLASPRLSDEDVERIARRVAELLKERP
jgi:hypothetical protein